MKQLNTLANKVAPYVVCAVLVLVPFQGFLTVWCSSLFGHYTALRLLDDVALLVVLGVTCYWLLRDQKLRTWFLDSLLVRLIIAYVLLSCLLGVISYTKGEVTAKSLAYGLLINLRFPCWFLTVLLVARRAPILRQAWPKLLLIPAGVVVLFGVLQYTVLPHDFLAHFGYNAQTTIAPIETINHNANYIRIQSTLRGANPLGAYLVLIASAVGVFLLRGKRKLIWTAYALLVIMALYATGSRSAWIGTLLSLGVVGWLQFKTKRSRLTFGAIGLVLVIVASGMYLVLKDNTSLQNELFHTQTNSAVKATSDGAHASALKSGISDVLHQPLGDGPGTAGPASEYNGNHPARIAEDYYVQIAQETGWLGLILFVSMLVLVAVELYAQARMSRLALIIFASFMGIAFVNLLSHAWADDTLSYVWWGLAGIALSARSETNKHEA